MRWKLLLAAAGLAGALCGCAATEADVPVRASGVRPEVAARWYRADRIDLTGAHGALVLKVKNPSAETVVVRDIATDVRLHGYRLERASSAGSVEIRPGEAALVEVPVSYSMSRVGPEGMRSLRSSTMPYEISGSLVSETPSTAAVVPFEAAGTAPLLRQAR